MEERQIIAHVTSITPLTATILKLILTPTEYVDYQPGQYLQLLCAKEALSYSIANAPLGAHNYELHIRHTRDNPHTQNLLSEIKELGVVTLCLPKGDCHLKRLDPHRPIVFIAGGTGFAPVKAMIEQLLADNDPRPFELFWGARSQSDLYMDDKLGYWEKHVSHFHYFSLLSQHSKISLAELVIDKHRRDLKKWQIVISGPFDMVYSVRDYLVGQGVSPEQLFSDAFNFEQKKE